MTYFSVSEYYKKIFGRKVYKISLDAGCTCPTRDGTKGFGGCIFCSASGSGEFASDRNLSITDQINQGILLVEKKLSGRSKTVAPGAKYIAYFQNFTNTYGDEDVLISKYAEALKNPLVLGISIATRPDCISDSILEKINSLSKTKFLSGDAERQKYFSIEFGLQTSNLSSVEYIKRRFSNEEYVSAVSRVKKINPAIHIVTHIIFGLPGEGEQEMMETVRFALESGTDGVKLQVLNVLRGTQLEKDFLEKGFKILSQDEYFYLVKKALKFIPPEIVVHRLTGDGPKNLLIEPKWIMNKRSVLNALAKYLSD